MTAGRPVGRCLRIFRLVCEKTRGRGSNTLRLRVHFFPRMSTDFFKIMGMNSSELTFSFDVGSQSLGWAVVNSDTARPKIVAAGVRIFPEGGDRDQRGGM